MQLRAFLVVEVVQWLAFKWRGGYQVELGAVRQIRWLVDLDSTILNTDFRCLHGSQGSAFRAALPLRLGAAHTRSRGWGGATPGRAA